MNMPDIDWKSNTVTSNQYKKEISEQFISTLQDCGLKQLVHFPTRNDKTLDLFATSRPSLLTKCVPHPGISDHEIVIVESEISVKYKRPVRRKIYLWKKANTNNLKEDFQKFSKDFVNEYHSNKDINALWNVFAKKSQTLLDKHVPSKFTTQRFSQPWINRAIKRLSAKKQRYYKIQSEEVLQLYKI